MNWDAYNPEGFYDEMFEDVGRPRPLADLLLRNLGRLPEGELTRRQKAAEKAFFDLGITFNVYSSKSGLERIFPFDILPRIIEGREWDFIERGLRQRIHALNLFLDDIYHDQRIVKDGIIPGELIRSATGYRKACKGLNPPWGVWCHITGTDLVKDADGQTLRPRGQHPLPFRRLLRDRQPPGDEAGLPPDLRRRESAPGGGLSQPPAGHAAVPRAPLRRSRRRWPSSPPASTTPPISSTPSWPSRWAWSWSPAATWPCGTAGLWMRTTRGFRKVDVLYRRIDDDFLDPKTFRADSLLGRARPHGRVPRGHGWPSPTPPAPAWPTTRSSTPTCRKSSSTTWARRSSSPTSRPTCAGWTPDAGLRARAHARAGHQDRQRQRRLRRADRAPLHRGRAPGMGGPHQGQSPQLHRPAHPLPVARARDRGDRAARAATWTCAPSSSTAATSTSCPAASPAWPSRRDPWWSTPPRAAAARTPGCCRPSPA